MTTKQKFYNYGWNDYFEKGKEIELWAVVEFQHFLYVKRAKEIRRDYTRLRKLV